MGRLDGKVAIITGCGRGFGEALAKLFSKEGAAISISDIITVDDLWNRVGSKIKTSNHKVICLNVDVSKEDQVNNMVKETIKQFGRIDILVNNVGITGPTKDCWNVTLEEWNRTLSVNINGTFLCTKAVLPEMIERKSGRIINMSSITGKNPLPHRTPYATSKMGIIGFTRTLAVEVGKYNITVNAICPGLPGGERNLEMARDLAELQGKSFNAEEFRTKLEEQRRKGVLGGRYLAGEGYSEALISHDDVAYMALFLASDEAGKITGQDINVCGGFYMG
jgi:NAD(P)-dependent dehydrogenase (short-subunit alcohol dehydrogenase family)